MKAALALGILLFFPFVYAFECETDLCKFIEKTNLTDKETLMAEISADEKNISLKEFVWGQNLTFNPDLTDRDFIKDARIKSYIIPSVYNETLLTGGKGKLKTNFDYRIEIPKPEECGKVYTFLGNKEELRIFLNNEKIGNKEKLSSFSVSSCSRSAGKCHALEGTNEDKNETYYSSNASNLDFVSVLNIEVKAKLDQYKNIDYCCGYADEKCIETCHKCDLVSSEEKTDSLALEDELKAERKDMEFGYNISLNNEKNVVFEFSGKNIEGFKLDFGNGYYERNDVYYEVNDSKLILKQYPQEKTNLITKIMDKRIELELPKKPEKCEIEAFGYFETEKYSCNLKKLRIAVLKLWLNRYDFDLNETITAFASFSSMSPLVNQTIIIKYGNVSKKLLTNSSGIAFANFTADYNNKIEAFFNSDFVYSSAYDKKVIAIIDRKSWEMFFLVLASLSIIWFFSEVLGMVMN